MKIIESPILVRDVPCLFGDSRDGYPNLFNSHALDGSDRPVIIALIITLRSGSGPLGSPWMSRWLRRGSGAAPASLPCHHLQWRDRVMILAQKTQAGDR